MNNMHNLTKELQHIINSTDWTTSPEREQLAREYYDFCQSFSENIEKCRDLLERKMLVEAAELANRQEPPLSRQLELLNFSGIDDYRVLCSIYAWPNPPELDGSVLEQLKTMMHDAANLQPLLSAYRQVVRSDNIKMKILLLRRLAEVDQQKPGEWKKALNQQETIMMEQLIQQAKNMILEKNYDVLQQLLQQITDPEWTITPPVQVVCKIESVLEEHRLAELKNEAVLCLNKINEAYSSFDFEPLGKALSVWKSLISGKAYQPDEIEVKQVEEAESYWLEQHKKQQEENLFNSQLQRLSQLLGSNGLQDEMDMIYNQLMLLGRPLPENVLQQYFVTRENHEIIQRRKRISRNIAYSFCAVLLIALIGIGTHLFIRYKTEQKWVVQLENALTKQPTSAVARDMIRDLKKNDPALCQSPAISALISRADKMFEAEEQKRKDFIKLSKEIRILFKSYEKNRTNIKNDFKELEKLMVDQKEKNAMNELKSELAGHEELFQERKKNQYDGLIGQIGRKRGQFYGLLEVHQYSDADKLLDEISLLEKQSAQIYEFIRKLIPGRESDFAQSADLRKILDREQKKFKDMMILLAEIREPSSVDQLAGKLNEFIKLYPKDGLAAKFEKLRKSAAIAGASVKVLSKGIPAEGNIFSQDLDKVLKYRKNSRETAAKTIDHFKSLSNGFADSPLRAIVAKDESKDVIYDFYYIKDTLTNPKNVNGTYDFTLKVISNDDGDTKSVDFRYASASPQKIKLKRMDRECTLIYPDPHPFSANPEAFKKEIFVYKSNRAPYMMLVEEIYKMIKVSSDGNDFEPTLIKVLDFLIKIKDKDESVNCSMRASLIGIIYKFLEMLDKENPSYRNFSSRFKSDLVSKINWLETYENPAIQKELRKNTAAAADCRLVSRNSVRKAVWEKLVSMKLTPAGYIDGNRKNLVFHPFSGVPDEGDLWLISSSPDSPNIIIGKYKGKTVSLLPGAETLDVDYSVLLTPAASISTEKVNGEIQKMLQISGVSSPLVSWPVFADKQKNEEN